MLQVQTRKHDAVAGFDIIIFAGGLRIPTPGSTQLLVLSIAFLLIIAATRPGPKLQTTARERLIGRRSTLSIC
jgi:multisubunit Na+/H+ antiporter MnhB subunit